VTAVNNGVSGEADSVSLSFGEHPELSAALTFLFPRFCAFPESATWPGSTRQSDQEMLRQWAHEHCGECPQGRWCDGHRALQRVLRRNPDRQWHRLFAAMQKFAAQRDGVLKGHWEAIAEPRVQRHTGSPGSPCRR
jgi:hypothetical protein